jgi:hypothetical protein
MLEMIFTKSAIFNIVFLTAYKLLDGSGLILNWAAHPNKRVVP